MQKSGTPLGQSLQFRITVDLGMGPFRDWLLSLPPTTRSRELLHLMRLGFAISNGGQGLLLGAARTNESQQPTPGSVGQTSGDSLDALPSQANTGKGAMQDIEAFDAQWDVASFCTPPAMASPAH